MKRRESPLREPKETQRSPMERKGAQWNAKATERLHKKHTERHTGKRRKVYKSAVNAPLTAKAAQSTRGRIIGGESMMLMVAIFLLFYYKFQCKFASSTETFALWKSPLQVRSTNTGGGRAFRASRSLGIRRVSTLSRTAERLSQRLGVGAQR